MAFVQPFGVTFPLFEKANVNGDTTRPVFKYCKSACPGLLGTTAIKWNFTKFLIDKSGTPVARYGPKDEPNSLVPQIEALLAAES